MPGYTPPTPTPDVGGSAWTCKKLAVDILTHLGYGLEACIPHSLGAWGPDSPEACGSWSQGAGSPHNLGDEGSWRLGVWDRASLFPSYQCSYPRKHHQPVPKQGTNKSLLYPWSLLLPRNNSTRNWKNILFHTEHVAWKNNDKISQ